MTAVLLGRRVDTAPRPPAEPSGPDPERVWQRVSNLFLDLHYLAEDIARWRRQSDAIGIRLADPAIDATEEQRNEARAKEVALSFQATSATAQLRRIARSVVRLWPDLSPEDQQFMEIVAQTWSESPMWRVIEGEPMVAAMPVWTTLLRAAARGPVNTEEVPF